LTEIQVDSTSWDPPFFRQLTTRYTTAVDTKTPKPEMPEERPEERERLLRRYSARDRWLVEDVLKAHPTLTVAKAIEHLEAFGGLLDRAGEGTRPASNVIVRAHLVSNAMHESVTEILAARSFKTLSASPSLSRIGAELAEARSGRSAMPDITSPNHRSAVSEIKRSYQEDRQFGAFLERSAVSLSPCHQERSNRYAPR